MTELLLNAYCEAGFTWAISFISHQFYEQSTTNIWILQMKKWKHWEVDQLSQRFLLSSKWRLECGWDSSTELILPTFCLLCLCITSVLASRQPVKLHFMEANISSFSGIRAVESVYAANPHKWKCFALYKKHCGTLEGPHYSPEDFDFLWFFFSCVSTVWCLVMYMVDLNPSFATWEVCVEQGVSLTKLLLLHMWNGGNDSAWLLYFIQYQTQKALKKQ